MSKGKILAIAAIIVMAALLLPSAISVAELTTSVQNASTEELVPVIIMLNTDAWVSSSGVTARSTAFDLAKQEVSSILGAGELQSMAMANNRGKIKRDLHIIDAISADILPSMLDELLNSSAVNEVYPDEKLYALLADSVPWINASDVWLLLDSQGDNVTGKGVVVAVLDTGVDYRHPDLGGGKGTGYKVVTGHDYVNDDLDPMDDDGHGTQMAGIIAANGDLKGVAPDATLLAYKVLDSSGAGDTSATIAAIEAAIKEGADIISMSLGGILDTTNQPLAEAINRALDAGVIVVAAAGNDGPLIGSIRDPGSYERVITVGATGEIILKVVVENKTLDAYTMLYSPLTNTSGELAYAELGYSDNFSSANCTFTNKIALIERGFLTFEKKVENAHNAGAIGVIIFNNEPGGLNEKYTGYTLGNASDIPAVLITQEDGKALLDLMSRKPVIVSMTVFIDKDLRWRSLLGVSSSRGPGPGYIIKPDIVAPGCRINSTALSGEYNASREGTSLAVPHVSGACALLLQLHPDWTPEMIKAALMNNAHDLGYCVFEQGAGRVDVLKAAKTEFLALPPSISASMERYANSVITVRNLQNYTLNVNISVANEEAFEAVNMFWFSPVTNATPINIDITPTLTLGPGESKPVNLNVTLPEDILNLHYCGRIVISSTNSSIAVPFAFRSSNIIVDKNESIQLAIMSAAAGDTILVAEGNYCENVVIDKPVHIRSLAGPSKTVITASDSMMPIFKVNSNNVTICGFGIMDADVGIMLSRSEFSNISNNNISKTACGIKLTMSNTAYIEGNAVFDNACGIALSLSPNALLKDNIMFDNENGIELSQSNTARMEKNTLSNNDCGIALSQSATTLLKDNTVFDNDCGIELRHSNTALVENNTVFGNNNNIDLTGSHNNYISRNNISTGGIGIALKLSNYNTISNNTVQKNGVGIDFSISNSNILHNNNMINNTEQVEGSGTNIWDGNYWSNYAGEDNDNDGIGDTPYPIDSHWYEEDKHPYMQKDGWL
jgi:minor extracellular serine protease Vpr